MQLNAPPTGCSPFKHLAAFSDSCPGDIPQRPGSRPRSVPCRTPPEVPPDLAPPDGPSPRTHLSCYSTWQIICIVCTLVMK